MPCKQQNNGNVTGQISHVTVLSLLIIYTLKGFALAHE